MTVRTGTHAWTLSLAIGILLILIGLAALAATAMTGLITAIYVGIMLVVVGILEVIAAFRVRHTGGPFLAYLLAGLLSVVVGALFLDRPLVTLASLTLLVAGYFFASGLFRAIVALSERYPRWGLDLGYALVTLALGVIIAVTWPFSSFWVIGTVVAVEILVRGIMLVTASWLVRDFEHRIPAAV